MKFKYNLAPAISSPIKTKDLMAHVIKALLFVSLCSIILQVYIYGIEAGFKAILIMLSCTITCFLVDYFYLRAIKEKNIKIKIQQNVPIITGLILALSLPLGQVGNYQIIYVSIISSIIAELFGKLIYGGFGQNIFNPAAVGRAFAILSFSSILIIPQIDGLSSATPLQELASETTYNLSSLFTGVYGGVLGETLSIPLLIALAYLIYKKVISWIIPVSALVMFALLALVNALFNNYDLSYVLVQLLSGGLLFACVFMITDPVTNPINNQGLIIFGMIFAFLTYIIRVQANLPEGVVFAILLVNMLTPLINRYTANVTRLDTNKKIISIVACGVILILLALLFQFV